VALVKFSCPGNVAETGGLPLAAAGCPGVGVLIAVGSVSIHSAFTPHPVAVGLVCRAEGWSSTGQIVSFGCCSTCHAGRSLEVCAVALGLCDVWPGLNWTQRTGTSVDVVS
jgi:hypothetical protein